ncbi:MAG: PASTA domain-containing protein [Fermentimonas sp.]|nr:PASTA domain-containing protein [Fermentimonas sp.]
MSKKKVDTPIFGNSILKNISVMVITGIILVVIVLLLLNLYTRHGQNVVVPRLEGLQIEEANIILKAKGLHAEIVDSVYLRDAVPGAILDQTPKSDNKVKEGRSIYVTVYSKNPQQIAVPGLVDYSTRQAVALLNSLGFTQLSIEEVASEYSGLVMAVEYHGRALLPDEKIPAGSPLNLKVSSSELADSLGVNDEIIIAPGRLNNNSENQSSGEGGFDDSFF